MSGTWQFVPAMTVILMPIISCNSHKYPQSINGITVNALQEELRAQLMSATSIELGEPSGGLILNSDAIEAAAFEPLINSASVCGVEDMTHYRISSEIGVEMKLIERKGIVIAEYTYYYPDMMVTKRNGRLIMLRISDGFSRELQSLLLKQSS
jgi:hypothetical protein